MADRFRVLLVAAVCAATLDAHALSLGQSRGEAVVGQPLELAFDLTLDAGADANSACVGADLFYGESRIDPSRVRVTTRPGAQTAQAVVLISTAVAVNEPVVSVVLRAGCSPAMSRRYVLLSSSPVEPATAAAAGVRPLSASVEPARLAAPTTLPPLPSRRSPVTAPTERSTVVRAEPARPPVARRPAAPIAAERAADAARNAKPRLELQSPAEWLQEQDLPLHASLSMATPLTPTAEQRAAAAALWRSLSGADGAPPSDGEAQQRLQALEAQVKALQSGARLARGREADLQSQLAETQRDRDAVWLFVWPAVGLLALALLAGGYFLWRRRSAGGAVWWKGKQTTFGDDAVTGFGEGFVDTRPADVDFLFPVDEGKARSLPAEDSISPPAEPAFVSSGQPVQDSHFAPTSAEAAMRAARELRNGSANDLADVQQNADFFASLGQYEQAIELLQQYIASHPGTSPVAYLDLLKLFHTLSLTDPYRKLRIDFNAVFNADVPPFASFLKASRDLVGYVDVLQRISDAWAQPHVLDLIESLLVRHAGEGAHPPFQLEAYRDLLLLYEIAKIEHGASGGARLTAPPSALPAQAPAAPVVAPVPVAPTLDVVPPAVLETPLPVEFAPLDFDIEAALRLPPAPTSVPDLGVALDFSSGAAPARAPHPSLNDIALPEIELPPAHAEAATPAGDPHLIDFDMFDVGLPPPDKTPKR